MYLPSQTGASLRARNQSNGPAGRMILPVWFDYVEESFSYKEVQYKMFSLPVKTSCPCDEKVNETPVSDGK